MRKWPVASALGSLVLLAGCATSPVTKPPPRPTTLRAVYTSAPVTIDGILEEEVWNTAPAYPLSLSADLIAQEKDLAEPGEARLAWDDTHLYLAIRFTDSDVVAEGTEDELHHYRMGDLAELFLKPDGYTWYWELYVTPTGRKTSFWFPGRGRLGLESAIGYECGLQVAARSEGTANHWEDRDRCWTAEMAMPVRDLTAHGETFRPGSNWRVFIARYNYSRYLPRPELSMCPPLPVSDFHLHEGYGILELVK